MKILFIFLATVAFNSAFSQRAAFRFYDPSLQHDVIEGQGWPSEVKHAYDRFPARAEQTVRQEVWNISRSAAGLQLRFVTDAFDIMVSYAVENTFQFPHMPATGVSGIDLYARKNNGEWLWAAGKYSFGDTITYRFAGLVPGKKEFTLYLPLYNAVKWLRIGVPEQDTCIMLPARKKKPVIVYGTSIAQGACASRPGLAWTNILSRRLDRPVINLGFSGNGRLEPEVIRLLLELDPAAYVLDCLPNMIEPLFSSDELKKRLVDAIVALRNGKPSIPVLLTAHDGYTDGGINPERYRQYTEANKALKQVFDSLSATGMKKLYLLTKEAIGQNIETTVDGTHPNDLGMMLYADAYEKKLKEILGKTP